MAILASMTSWLTPTSLFVFLNLVIGTIYLTSRLASPPPSRKNDPQSFYSHPHPPPLARAPSLLDRVRSINFSTYSFPEPDTSFADHPVQLHRSPSLLERVRSINFSTYKYPEPETSYTDNPVQLQRAPSLLDRIRSIKFSDNKLPEPESDHPVQVLHRAPSLLERVQSLNMSSFYKFSGPEAEEEREEERRVELTRPKSESVLQKTTSFGDEAVDAKADDFINRFRDQLRLQRLESILRSKAN